MILQLVTSNTGHLDHRTHMQITDFSSNQQPWQRINTSRCTSLHRRSPPACSSSTFGVARLLVPSSSQLSAHPRSAQLCPGLAHPSTQFSPGLAHPRHSFASLWHFGTAHLGLIFGHASFFASLRHSLPQWPHLGIALP